MKYIAVILLAVGVGIWSFILVLRTGTNTQTKPAETASQNPAEASGNIIQTFGNLLSQESPTHPTPTPTPQISTSKAAPRTAGGTTTRSTTSTQPLASSGLPKTLSIPKIGVRASIEYVGLDATGKMDVPKQWSTVAWYQLGYRVGDNGSAVLSGHYDTSSGAPAVFYNIGKLSAGDELVVTDDRGTTLRFRVTERQYYPWDGVPLDRVFGSGGKAQLNLITCGGNWDRSARNYSNRIVIYSELIQ